MTIEARKYHLIEGIMKVSDEGIISKLEQILKDFSEASESIKHLVKPMRKKLDIDELIAEQGFAGVDKTKIDHLIEEMAIEEPIDDLLEMI
jgi:hypothetical protein